MGRLSRDTTVPSQDTSTLLTVRDWLRYAVSRFNAADLFFGHGSSNAYDEAAYLILHTLHLPLDRLEPFLDARLLPEETARIVQMLNRRIDERLPAPYLTNEAWLQGYRFYVDERVIVPRSFLAPMILEQMQPWLMEPENVFRALDLCTGSGCLAIIMADVMPNARVDAVDLSADALAVARGNADALGVGARVATWEGDLWAPLAGRRFHLVTANPPYIPSPELDGLMPDVRDFEPRMALDGGPDGTALLGRLLADARAHLLPGATIVVELHWDQGPAAVALAEAAGLVDAEATRDWSGHTRYLRARAPTD